MRVAATPRDGLGHAKRMIALAAALRGLGAQISAPDLLSPNANPMIRSSAESLGMVPSADDAECVVFDSYELGAAEQEFEMARGRVVVVVDDAPTRPHRCSLLLDQNSIDHQPHRFATLVPENCRLLLGPAFALLGSEYQTDQRPRPAQVGPRRVVVNFGGSPQDALEMLAVEALNSAGVRPPEWEIVVAGATPARPSMRDLWESATLVVGAAGSSSWERARVGVRSVVVAIAANQEPVGMALAAARVARYAGRVGDTSQISLASAIRSALDDDPEDVARRGWQLVDGLGAHRVARAVVTVMSPLKLREATVNDGDLLYELRNAPTVVASFLSGRSVSREEHEKWLHRQLECRDLARIFVAQKGSTPAGFIRFDRLAAGDVWDLSYALADGLRGLGHGVPLVAAGISSLGDAGLRTVISAKVLTSNIPSLRTLRRVGFREVSRHGDVASLSLRV